MIRSLSGKYKFLSNFYDYPVTYNGITYRNSEAAYQAQKCPSRAEEFTQLSGKNAQQLGRYVQLPINWLMVRVIIMEEVLRAKFSDPVMRKRLIATGDQEIINGNNKYEHFWGADRGGENHLGKLLMKIRDEIK